MMLIQLYRALRNQRFASFVPEYGHDMGIWIAPCIALATRTELSSFVSCTGRPGESALHDAF